MKKVVFANGPFTLSFMPYALLAIGLLIAGIVLYRFMLVASRYQIRAMILTLLTLAVVICAVFLAITGRLPVAVGMLVALWPLGVAWARNRQSRRNLPETTQNNEDETP